MPVDSMRIVFFDLDGTLLSKDHLTVSPRVADTLRAAHEAGLLLAVATGRCRGLLPPAVQALPFDYYLTSNGADVYRTCDGSHPVRMHMAREDAALAWSVLKPYGFFVEWFIDGGIGVDESVSGQLAEMDMPHWHRTFFAARRTTVLRDTEAYLASGAPGLERINVVRCSDAGMRSEALQSLARTGRYELSSSTGRNIEINRQGCTKGEAIRRLCAQLHISRAQAMAFGDGNNDLDMLQAVGHGVAMGNALPSVLAVAAAVTDSNERDGVAIELERWIAQELPAGS